MILASGIHVVGAELFDAVERNDLVAVEELLSREADVNSLDPRCPLWYAAPPLVNAAVAGYSERDGAFAASKRR